MRPDRTAAALAAAAALLGGCDHHVDVAGPAGLPYACSDGRSARIFFDGGDPNRASARLRFDGREFALTPVPAMSGLRYVAENGLTAGHALVWSAQGDEASLTELPADPASEEREVVRCSRVREGEATTAEPHGAHGDDH